VLCQPGHRRHPLGAAAAGRRPDPEAELQALAARQPTGRLVTAEEVAAAIAYLASPLAGATTGTVLAVDGGMHGLRLPAPPGS
jgi:2-keto-3-deoxy-L-fuconate dehydrogenase